MKRQSTEIRQEQIKQAVLDIIYTDGLKNLSTRNLANKIGMSEGTIFRHFPTKQNIVLSIIKDVQNEFIGSLRSIVNVNSDPEKRLYKFILQTTRYLIENKGITVLLFSEASHNNDVTLKTNLMQIFNSQKNLVSKIILDGIATEKWDDKIPVENIAMMYMGIPVSLNIELALNGSELNINDFCNKMFHLLMKLLAK